MISFTIISTKRSGSTLLRTLLNATQMVYIPKESHIFSIDNMFELDFNVFKDNVIKKDRLDINKYSNCENFDEFFNCYFRQVVDEKKLPNLIYGEKTPENIDHIKNILYYNPKMKFIILERNFYDTILSLENRGWEGPFFLNRLNYLRRCI